MKSCVVRSSFEEVKERFLDENNAQRHSLMDASAELQLIAVAHNSSIEFYTLESLQLVYSKQVQGGTITALRFIPRTLFLACAVFPLKASADVHYTQTRQITGRTCIFKVCLHGENELPVTCHMQRVYHVRGPLDSVALSIAVYPWSVKENEFVLYHKFKRDRHFMCRFSTDGGSLCDDEVDEIRDLGESCSDLAFGIDRVVVISAKMREVGPLYDGGFRAISRCLAIGEDRPRSVELVSSNVFAVIVRKDNGVHVLRIYRAVDAKIEPLRNILLGNDSVLSWMTSASKWQGIASLTCSNTTGSSLCSLSGLFWNVNEDGEAPLSQGCFTEGLRGNTLLGSTVFTDTTAKELMTVVMTERELGLLRLNLNELQPLGTIDLGVSPKATRGKSTGNANTTVKVGKLSLNGRTSQAPMHSLFGEVRELKAELDNAHHEVRALKSEFCAFTEEVTTFMQHMTRELHQAGARS